MASFSVHLYGGAVVSSAGSLGAYSLGFADAETTQLLFLLGVVGSLLPDVDSDHSKSARSFFTFFGVILASLMCFSLFDDCSAGELLTIWCLILAAVRFALLKAFSRYTVHRGAWHSWLGMAFAALASTNLAFYLHDLTPLESWLAGSFVALGYLTHLLLDELASLDLSGSRIRRSFGTALKPVSVAHPGASLAMLAAATGLYVLAPSPIQLGDSLLALNARIESQLAGSGLRSTLPPHLKMLPLSSQ